MSQLLDEHDELLASPSREMTLGTGSILAIFLGLALLCAVFFGFGYNVGHKSASAAALSARSETGALSPTGSVQTSETFSGFKPPATTPVKAAADTAPSSSEPASASSGTTGSGSTSGRTTSVRTSATGAPASAPPSAHPEGGRSGSPAITSHTPPEPLQPAVSGTAPAGSFFVQVAAVSHPEDASLLLGALRSRGYAVAQRADPADKLIHLQIGPFPSKPAAEAMRQRVQADGYNAIIK